MANVGYATLQIIPSVRGIGNELRRQLVAPAGDAGDAAGNAAGGGFADSFTGALAAIGVAGIAEQIGGQFTDAFSQALEQGSVTKTLQGQLGSSGPVAARQGAAVGKLFASGVTENFSQGAEAVRAIVSGGLVPPGATVKQLDVIGTKMVDVANTFGTDMSLQSQAVSAILKNKLAPDATAALDLITAGFQRLGPNAEDLLETFQEYSVQLKKLGLDANTSMGLFSQGIQGGARDTDIIADAFKEFSIRAVDMSESSQTAYESIGLNAEKMSLQIAKGGKGATAGLQTVLDKLRDIDDPVKRESAAVGLFGTQAEDLGSSLFKLDPGKARAAFGDVEGAATKLGKTLRSGPSHEIKVFTRTVKQGLVDFIGGQVLPILGDWGSTTARVVLPPLREVGGFLGAVFVPALVLVGAGISGTIGWLREWGIWLTPLLILVGGLTLALNAQAIATGIVTAVFSVYRAAIIVGTAVTGGFTAAQALLNSVMALNPITLVVIALVALGAAIVIAWKRSETFRNIVMGAWEGIKTAAVAAWTGFIKPAVDGFMTGLRAIGAAAVWLWTTVLAPTFSLIATAAKVLLTAVVVVVLLPIIATVKLLGAIFGWLWDVAIGPTINLIVAGFQLWWSGIQPVFGYFMTGVRALGAVGVWLWSNALSPAISSILLGVKLMWSGTKVVFGYFTAGLRALGAASMSLWKNAISPAFQGIGSLATWLYEKGIKPALDKGKAAAKAFGAAFTSAKNTIGEEFDKIRGLAKSPINFVINTVYNKGIVPVWNKVAGAFGAPKLGTVKGLATGGPVVGAGTETSDDVPAWLSRNEHVWTAREVRGAGGHGAVMALRKWAAAGGGDGAPGFKGGGGLFGWIGSAGSALKGFGSAAWDKAKAGAGWLKETIAGSARAGINAIVNPLLDRIPGLGSGIGKMIARIPARMIDSLLGYSKEADKKGGSGPGKWQRPVSAALGTRYGVKGNMWSSGYHTGTDFPAATGTAVRAALGGKVASATSGGPYGRHIRMTHAGGYSTLYAHLSSMGVRAGQSLASGARIGAVGATGNTTGPHLHFEVRKGGALVNPEPLLGYSRGGRPRAGELAWVGENGPELLRFRGSEEVFDNRTSLGMAAGLPGFAKGTGAAPGRAMLAGMARLELALDSTAARVAAAAVRAADAAAAATTAAPSMSTAGQATGGRGFTSGQKVRLVVRDREFDAYIETVADGRIDESQQQLVQLLDAGGGN